MAVRFGVSSTVKNRLPRYSNFWDGTAVYSPFSPTGSYDALASYTVPSGGVSSITFAGLPTGGQYQHLQIRILSNYTSSSYENVQLQLNGTTSSSSYKSHQLQGNGSSASAYSGATSNFTFVGSAPGTSSYANIFGAAVVDILDYASTTKNKTIRSLQGFDANGSGNILLQSGLYFADTNAINSIRLFPGSSNFGQYTNISLYGVKG